MLAKNINIRIANISRVSSYGILLAFAVVLAHFIWWMFEPLVPEVYVNLGTASQHTGIANNIISQTPFGVVKVEKVEEKPLPSIIDKIDLTAVYVSSPKDSIAIFEIDKKPAVFKVGDTLDQGVVLQEIAADHVVVMQGKQAYNVPLVGGTQKSNYVPANSGNGYAPPIPGAQEYPQPNSSVHTQDMNNPSNNQTVGVGSGESQSANQDQAAYDKIIETRRKLIEQMIAKERASNPASN